MPYHTPPTEVHLGSGEPLYIRNGDILEIVEPGDLLEATQEFGTSAYGFGAEDHFCLGDRALVQKVYQDPMSIETLMANHGVKNRPW